MLRQPSHFEWAVLALVGLVAYVYAVEVERKRWDIVIAGVVYWMMDWFNELVNSAVLHISHRAALWTVTGDTSYLIMIGVSIEISLYFLLSGVVFAKVLPSSREARIAGIPSRVAYVAAFSCVSAAAEVVLQAVGVLHWGYWWWNVVLVAVVGYAPSYAITAWVFGMGSKHRRQLCVVGSIAAVDAALALAFGLAGWL